MAVAAIWISASLTIALVSSKIAQISSIFYPPDGIMPPLAAL
jgi:hypothetical protein